MDFFEAQNRARRRTRLLVALFAGAVIAIVVAVYLVVLLAEGVLVGPSPRFDPALFAGVALGTGALIGGGSLFRTAGLRKGGSAVASLLGGRRVSPDTGEPHERRLVNVVEEMALASGVPVPAIFVLEGEQGINAFAAGHTLRDAAVAVTRGALERLDRDELQGVMAHEFSHILNGDMRLNVRLVGLLFGILLLAVVGRGLLRGSVVAGRRRSDGRAALVGVALLVLGYVGVLFGKVIKSAVSREREFLADAAAVQFTRNPDGIAGALKKIGARPGGSGIRDYHAEELSHLFFAEGVGGALSRLFSTHPPLAERIRRIDPVWDGRFPEAAGEGPRAASPGRSPARPRGGGARPGAGTAVPGALPGPAALAGVPGRVDAPRAVDLGRARWLLDTLPGELREAAHDPERASALALALVGAQGSGDEGPPVPPELPARDRLVLLDLALPTLSALPASDARSLSARVDEALQGDAVPGPFEGALARLVLRRLEEPKDREPSPRRRRRGRAPASGPEVEILLSALARAGREDPAAVREAFEAGVAAMGPSRGAPALRTGEGASPRALAEALARLESAPLELRRRVLEGCAATLAPGNGSGTRDSALLRAVAECLEVPLAPPAPSPDSR